MYPCEYRCQNINGGAAGFLYLLHDALSGGSVLKRFISVLSCLISCDALILRLDFERFVVYQVYISRAGSRRRLSDAGRELLGMMWEGAGWGGGWGSTRDLLVLDGTVRELRLRLCLLRLLLMVLP